MEENMSADNWTECPRCLQEEVKKKDELMAQADSAYGTIPKAEYLELLKKSGEPLKAEQTLREDYEFWTNPDGEFKASYRCHCDRCGFKHTFKHEEQLKL